MSLAAVKKPAIKLPPKQRLQLADVLYESLPILPGSVGLAELELRADEVISGKVKGIPWEEFKKELTEMRKSITPCMIYILIRSRRVILTGGSLKHRSRL
jgi:putative addiction module component (TIGR02574 family)